MERPDYGFANGLIVGRVAHLAPAGYDYGQPGDRLQVATADDVVQLSTEPYRDKDYVDTIVDQMRSPRYIRSLGGVGVEAVIINGSADTGRVAFHFYGWGGNLRHPNAQREAITLAYHDPEAAHVFINGPGIGNSSMLPRTAQR